jgi:nucleoside-diphosphate-sugar epimerase
VITVAKRVAELAEEELGVRPEVKLVENPRGSSEMLVEDFSVDILKTKADLGWEPQYGVDTSVRELLWC